MNPRKVYVNVKKKKSIMSPVGFSKDTQYEAFKTERDGLEEYVSSSHRDAVLNKILKLDDVAEIHNLVKINLEE